MFGVCFATLTFPSCRWHGQGGVTAGRERRQRAAFRVSNISSHLTHCHPLQQHWEETGGLGGFKSLCSFLGGTNPTSGLPNQSRQSPKQALNHLDTGISLPGDLGGVPSLPKDRRRAAGANIGYKALFFQSKVSSSSCPREPLVSSPLSATGPGCNPCWDSAAASS